MGSTGYLTVSGNLKSTQANPRVTGISLSDDYETVQDRSEYICSLFFNRTPEDRISSKSLTGIRDMVDYDADLVEKELTRRLNKEFDWKRRPYAIATCPRYHDHVIFDTVPWQSVEDFQDSRAVDRIPEEASSLHQIF